MGEPQGIELDQSYRLDRLTLDELSELYAAVRAGVRGYHPAGHDAELLEPGTPEHSEALDQLSRIEFEVWYRLTPWMLRIRSAIEASVAAVAPGAEIHVVPNFTYPGPPSQPLAMVGYVRADPLGVMSLVGFTLRIRPRPPGPAGEDPPWTEVFLGGVDARTGKVYDRDDYGRERTARLDHVSEPGLQEPDLWPGLLMGSPLAIVSRTRQLAMLLGGAFAEFGSDVAEDVVASVIEAAIEGPPGGWSTDDAERAAYQSWKLLLDAVYDAAEQLAVEEEALDNDTDGDGDGEPEMTPAPEDVLGQALQGPGETSGGTGERAGQPGAVDPERPPLPDDAEVATDRPGLPDDAEVAADRPGLPDDAEVAGERLDLPDDDEAVDRPEGFDSDGDGVLDMTPASREVLDRALNGADGVLDMTPASQEVLDRALDGADDGGDAVAPLDPGGSTL